MRGTAATGTRGAAATRIGRRGDGKGETHLRTGRVSLHRLQRSTFHCVDHSARRLIASTTALGVSLRRPQRSASHCVDHSARRLIASTTALGVSLRRPQRSASHCVDHSARRLIASTRALGVSLRRPQRSASHCVDHSARRLIASTTALGVSLRRPQRSASHCVDHSARRLIASTTALGVSLRRPQRSASHCVDHSARRLIASTTALGVSLRRPQRSASHCVDHSARRLIASTTALGVSLRRPQRSASHCVDHSARRLIASTTALGVSLRRPQRSASHCVDHSARRLIASTTALGVSLRRPQRSASHCVDHSARRLIASTTALGVSLRRPQRSASHCVDHSARRLIASTTALGVDHSARRLIASTTALGVDHSARRLIASTTALGVSLRRPQRSASHCVDHSARRLIASTTALGVSLRRPQRSASHCVDHSARRLIASTRALGVSLRRPQRSASHCVDHSARRFTLSSGDYYTAWVDYDQWNRGSIKEYLADSKAALFFGFVASNTVKPFLMDVIRSSAVRTGKRWFTGVTDTDTNECGVMVNLRGMDGGDNGVVYFGGGNANNAASCRCSSAPLYAATADTVVGTGACWAYALVASVEAAYGIALNQAAPQLSVESLFAAMGLTGTDKCTAGGSPTAAFETLVTLDNSSGLTAANDTAFKYQDPACCTGSPNHVVLVVGYFINRDDGSQNRIFPPSWIIRNSWSVGWADSGHMYMDIQGGYGVCRINVLPGIYPIVRALAKGSVVQLDGASDIPCTALFYALKSDTCSSISVQLSLGAGELAKLNRGLNCSTNGLKAGQSVCIERSSAVACTVPECLRYGTLTAQTTCERIIQKYIKETGVNVTGTDWVNLYHNNPDLTCSSTIPSNIQVQVTVARFE
ncbi:unnamed protein product [Closterium sp. Yama58-4]|nr:unnamed protein product [Closterium sp. Yama58-4]